LNKFLSKKDKKDWKNFIEGKEKIVDKDSKYFKKKNLSFKEKTIDLHGYSLENANSEVYNLVKLSYKNNISKLIIITGKGSRSKNIDDPFQSVDLSILKYSVPNYIKNNNDLMKMVKEINFEEVNDSKKGSFSIFLKTKV